MIFLSELSRIAEALERAYPPLVTQSTEEMKPEDVVSYVDEEKMAQDEAREQASAIEQWLAEHPEEAPVEEDLFSLLLLLAQPPLLSNSTPHVDQYPSGDLASVTVSVEPAKWCGST